MSEGRVVVHWLTAFVDLPAESFDRAVEFWQEVTGTHLSPARGEHGEFATLLPADGDAFLRVQRVLEGPGGVHLDLHVDDVGVASYVAVGLGATLVENRGHRIMRSPAGLTFCLVRHEGESKRPRPHRIEGVGTSRADQVCLDVPAAALSAEAKFWSTFTGWPYHPASLPEFGVLERPLAMPLRVLLQRLGDDDTRTVASAHLDLAAGDDVDALAAHHVALGAELVQAHERWTTLRDPAGLAYCLTHRNPATGSL